MAPLFAARARQDAVRLNRQGDFDAAVKGLHAVARRIHAYAGSDPELNALASKLRDEEQQWAAPVHELLRKESYADASYLMRSRGPAGKARK